VPVVKLEATVPARRPLDHRPIVCSRHNLALLRP